MKISRSEKMMNIFLYVFLIFLCILTMYPLVNSLILSLSFEGMGTESNIFALRGKGSIEAWKGIVYSLYMWRGFWNSITRTVIGSVVSILLTTMMAYPLSKKQFIGYKTFNAMIVASMMFNVGAIPNYILMKNLNLIDNFLVLILPGAVSAFNLIVLRNFFQAIPASLEESAKLDGANEFIILFKIIVPMSMPALATISLWVMVANWNSWFDVVLYISSREKFLLPAILREIVVSNTLDDSFKEAAYSSGTILPTTESMQAAATLFTTIPILLVYPFIQRYFVKGIMLGSVKG